MRLSKAIIGVGLGATLLLSGPAASIATAADTATPNPATDSGCDKGAWPARAQGQPPTFEAGAEGGAYVWHDTSGWHLRVTHKGDDEVTFAGTVRADQTISDKRVQDEKSDVVKDGKSDKAFAFRFKNYGHIDGVDFRTDCATKLRFRVTIKGHRMPVQRIFIGHDGSHPGKNPFTVTRRDRDERPARAPRRTTTTTAPASNAT
jgi:hypothetical protein